MLDWDTELYDDRVVACMVTCVSLLTCCGRFLQSVWILAAQVTNFEVLQLLLAFYTFTLFMKLDPFDPPTRYARHTSLRGTLYPLYSRPCNS